MNPKSTNYYRDLRRWETVTGKLWVVVVFGIIATEIILFVGDLITIFTDIPRHDWFLRNMPDWLALIVLIYIFASIPFFAARVMVKLPLYVNHLLLVILLLAFFFFKVAVQVVWQKEPWAALICFIMASLLYLFMRIRRKSTIQNEGRG
jgi:hypothetical protein